MEPSGKILVVDDEESMCDLLGVILHKEGYAVDTANSGQEALNKFRSAEYDLVIQDLKMPGMDGITLLRNLKQADPEMLVVIMTAYSTWDSAVEAMRLGAYDYIKKPFDNNDIKATIARAVGLKKLHESSRIGKDEPDPRVNPLIGHSTRMQEIYSLIRRVSPTDSTVLITGESGTGKELVARAIHHYSLRREQTFLSLNCGAFTESLLESELFGHKLGAFTGAVANKKGLLEVADKGTIFLDEVGEMPPLTQVKFLRVLENREFIPVGDTVKRKIDVRFVTATNKNLKSEVESGAFREDLYYRLNVIPIDLPPLREKKDDIPLLAGHFLARYANKARRKIKGLSAEAMSAIMNYDWPGNVRELENTMQRAVALCEGDTLDIADMFGRIKPLQASGRIFVSEIPDAGINLEARLGEMEKSYIEMALHKSGGNLTKAAEYLGMTFRSIRYKVRKYGIVVKA